MLFYDISVFCVIKKQCIFAVLTVLLYIVPLTLTETCTYINPCKCKFSNGSIIDLSPIASKSGAKFRDIKPKNDTRYGYYYNPCYNFKLGNEQSACAHGVAVCQVNNASTEYQNCGDQERVQFFWDDAHAAVVIEYRSELRATNVTLTCLNDPIETKLVVTGEVEENIYDMNLFSICACPDGCIENHISFGTGLVIIFFVSVLMYLLLGIVYNKLAQGAHGYELIPNYEFWKDFPLLVRDGCVYVWSGCRTESSYERI